MAGNKVTLVFAGDADQLSKAAKQAEKSTQGVADSVGKSGKEMTAASGSTSKLTTGLGHLGSATSGAMDAVDGLSGGFQAFVDIQNASITKAAKQARALADVEQAQEDFNQALRDSKQAAIDSGQAAIDVEQANLDAATALKDYNKAVKEHGKNSDEAKQAAIDLKQADQDLTQANEDQEQATRDAAQATIDAKTAQLDLNDANREAHPPELQKWADGLQLVTPLLSALVGILGLVTAVQWLWNTALLANPITWIVVGIVALVAAIVLIATKTTWFQDAWKWAWTGIKEAASWAWDGIVAGAKFVWDYLTKVWSYVTSLPGKLRDAFVAVTSFITAPFRAAFNYVSDAWNHTIGRLHWSVPDWVPFIGGNSLSAPTLPKFHTGGIVSGSLGAETLAVLQAGERITPSGGSGSFDNINVTVELVGDGVLKVVRAEVGKRGSVERALGGTRG